MPRWTAALVLVAALTAACTQTHRAAAPPPTPPTTPTTAAVERAWGLVFAQPLTLDQAEALAARNHAVLVAVWRTDSVCVTDVGFDDSHAYWQERRRHSAFAYVDADKLVERQNHGPPATDGGWSFAMRARFAEEWDAAQAAKVRLRGAALLVPAGASEPRDRDIEQSTPVESYRTDGVGVLYLRGHQSALAPLFPGADTSPC